MTAAAAGEEWWTPRFAEPRFSQSLERGLSILGCFTPKRPVLGISEIADDLGMKRSTTHRYVTTLAAFGYLEQVASRKYRLGLKVTKLGMSALSSTGLAEHAEHHLRELRRRTGFAASLAVLDGPEVVYVVREQALRRPGSDAGPTLTAGSRVPAYCTALGKVLLADLHERERRDLLAGVALEKRGPNTILTKKALRAELEQVEDEGMAVEDEELAPGLVAIAAPVRNDSKEAIAAIDLAAPVRTIALPSLVAELTPHLLSTAAEISARLGYRRGDEVGG